MDKTLNNQLTPQFKKFLVLLKKHEVEYMVVGGSIGNALTESTGATLSINGPHSFNHNKIGFLYSFNNTKENQSLKWGDIQLDESYSSKGVSF